MPKASIPHLRGMSLLNDASQNKGTAFTAEERRLYGLEGLLPTHVESLDRQVERIHRHLEAKLSDLERYIYLSGLRDQNQTLFYRVLMSNPAKYTHYLRADTGSGLPAVQPYLPPSAWHAHQSGDEGPD